MKHIQGTDAGTIRPMRIADSERVQALLNRFATEGLMLPRSLSEIYSHFREFTVYENSAGEPVGVVALHIHWSDMAEVRSFAVSRAFQGKGIGTALIHESVRQCAELGIRKLFTLTYRPGIFEANGFRQIKKERLPLKVWSDCIKCSKFTNCDETALIRTLRMPKSAKGTAGSTAQTKG